MFLYDKLCMKISIHECTFHFLISCGWSTHHIYICAYDAFSLYIYICIYASIVCNPESYYNPGLFIPIRSTEHSSRSVGSQGFVLQNQPIQCLDPPVFFRLHTFRFEVRWMRNVASRTAPYILGRGQK